MGSYAWNFPQISRLKLYKRWPIQCCCNKLSLVYLNKTDVALPLEEDARQAEGGGVHTDEDQHGLHKARQRILAQCRVVEVATAHVSLDRTARSHQSCPVQVGQGVD